MKVVRYHNQVAPDLRHSKGNTLSLDECRVSSPITCIRASSKDGANVCYESRSKHAKKIYQVPYF